MNAAHGPAPQAGPCAVLTPDTQTQPSQQGKARYVMPSVTEKRCTRCHETKPANAYGIDRSSRDGLFTWCRTCRTAHQTLRVRLVDPETVYTHRDGRTYPLISKRYARTEFAALLDDGHVDHVAVERVIDGDMACRITPREFACIVNVLADNATRDSDIAAAFGLAPTRANASRIEQFRARYSIESRREPSDPRPPVTSQAIPVGRLVGINLAAA